MLDLGSTSIIEQVSPGVVCKEPAVYLGRSEVDPRVVNCFNVERQILKKLDHHPRIVRLLGFRGDGILLSQASHGNLQAYLDGHPSTSLPQRIVWCRQLAEGIDYLHSHGVVHSDLRPGNVLVHETTPGARDLQLSDFGGSVCEELGLDGLSLPDGPFYSPVFDNKSGPLLDIFAMGSMFYTILTGRWPYKETPGRFTDFDEMLEWEEQVAFPKFKAEQFPDVQHLPGGAVILKCWMRQFKTARDVLIELEEALPVELDNDGNLKN